jgi:hypothetical protein
MDYRKDNIVPIFHKTKRIIKIVNGMPKQNPRKNISIIISFIFSPNDRI